MMYLLVWIVWTCTLFRVCLCYQSLVYGTSRDIRIMNLAKPKKSQTIVSDLQSVFAIDFCFNDSLICWSDTAAEEINCIPYSDTPNENKTSYLKILSAPSAGGLACDWITKKLYWTDSITKRIEVVSLKTKQRKVLFWQEVDQLRGIAVDPLSGFLFWTDWGEIPKIEHASMDGNLGTRKVIVNDNIFWPNSITLDVIDKKLYWIDARLLTLEVNDYFGKNRTVLLSKDLLYPFSLTRFADVLYWTDWKSSSIYLYNYTAKGPIVEVQRFSDAVMGVEVYSPSLQPSKSTPCDLNNGGCSHFCLLSFESPGYSCACPTGIRSINETTCANGVDHMLLLVQRGKISNISLDTQDYTSFKIPLKGVKGAMNIDYDPVEKFIYWTDDESKNIQRAKLDGSLQESVVPKDVYNLDGIAIDWIARNIYWSNFGASRIEVLRLNTTYRKYIIVDDIESPRAIAVSPQHGWLYWSDWSSSPKIERTDLDGSNRLILVKDDIMWPNGIALDLENKQLYWGDAGVNKIEVVNMVDGSNRRVIISNKLPHIFGITIHGNYLYWTDWKVRTLERINKHDGRDRHQILDQLQDVEGIKAIDINAKLGTNPCAINNGNCQQFCFYKPTQKVVCSCQIEYELGPDGKSCIIPEAFLIIHSVDHIQRVSILNNFSSEVIPVTGIKSISAIDVDIMDSRMYWADNEAKTINRAFLNGSHIEKTIEFGIHSPESLAIDWLSSNLYWADAGSKRIEVAKLNTNLRKTLFWKLLKEPRNLVLDPRIGYMYWSEWDGKVGAIFKASMDGSSKILFVPDTGRINGLTIDYAQRSLYWSQFKNNVATIEFCDSTGKYRRQVLGNSWFKPMAITQYEDYLFLVNHKNGTIIRADKLNGRMATIWYTQTKEIADLRVVHSSKQNGWNGCINGNGNCKSLCLVKPRASDLSTEHTCACPTHYVMKKGNCYPPEKFLLFSLKNALYRLLDSNDECPDIPLPVPNMKVILAIEYDPTTNYIYWIDGRAQAIKKSYEDGSHSEVIVNGNQSEKLFNFHDIALEPYNKLLFWSCSSTDSINVTRLSDSNVGHVYVASHGEKPRIIALHPEKSLLFWTDVGRTPRIMRSQLDGQNRLHIETDGKNVEGLTVDRELNLLYFSYSMGIFSSDLEGKKKYKLAHLYGKKIASLAVLDSFLYYWTDYKELPPCIEHIDKTTGELKGTSVDNVQVTDLISVKLLDDNAFLEHPCSSIYHHGNCSHICIRSLTNPYIAKCSCPIGMRLNEDGKTCSNPPPCNEEQFKCTHSTGECIPNTWHCDGTADCLDGSDEENCSDCNDGFKCRNGHCVKLNAVCDGNSDCDDGSDEKGCCAEEFLLFHAPYFRCASDGKCISKMAVCDDIKHCDDASDELECISKNLMKSDSYSDDTSYFVVLVDLSLIMLFVMISVNFVSRCKKKLKRSASINEQDHAELKPSASVNEQDHVALIPLAPNGRQIGTFAGDSITHSTMNGGESTDSYNRSHITGVSGSTSMNYCPLNPPPSPATTILRQECYCNQYSPPPPSPTPRSNSSDPPSSSSSIYFRPLPQPPPPSPTK